MNKIFYLLPFLLLITACSKNNQKEPVDYVNPFIGTDGHGHTYPGATVPFGMVQLSPDTRKDSWDGCSGYHYSDSVVFGFSHTHLSGTGIGDYGDIRIMPVTGLLKTEPGTATQPDSGYASRFAHDMEKASPGYYAIYLQDYDIYVGLTATEHAGLHQYLFPAAEEAYIILDLKESVTSEEIINSKIVILSDHEVAGFRRTDGWADDHYVYFYAEFSKPFTSYGIVKNGVRKPGLKSAKGDNLKAYFAFSFDAREKVFVKVGVSAVNVDGAKNNLHSEIPGWSFSRVKREAESKWKKQLEKIHVGGGTDEQQEIFYTAMYHTMLAPNLYSDVDGRYRGHDMKIHKDRKNKRYTVFSLWDTFRTLHPLFAIIERQRTSEFIQTMLDMYRHDGLLPVWELAANETNCMIGYHSVSVILDAYIKGIRDFDTTEALEAMQATANAHRFGLDVYQSKGYIPADKEGSSVSKTLEYAYNDWCIAQMAQLQNNEKAYAEFIRRAQYYKNLYDKETGFFRGKSNGCFVTPFNPAEVNFMLTEANTWQYNFFVPQDINTHIELLGGDEAYDKKLDELFTSEAELTGRHQSDITGLIGQYAHGNEPSHNMAYLYNYIGKPWKTQRLVRQILDEQYSSAPDGLCGNEDCGQLSAWYVMSAMGFYPVTPGSDMYVLGTPLFDTMKIKLENGKVFEVRARGASENNIYIHEVTYNGESWTKSYITHDMIMQGGVLQLVMGKEPKKSWGLVPANRPVQRIEDHLITPVPYFVAASKTFEDEMDIGLACIDEEAKLWWAQAGRKKTGFVKYEQPVAITSVNRYVAYAEKDGQKSFEEQAEFVKMPAGRTVKVTYPYSLQYTAGGDRALINTLRGNKEFMTGNWQGYWGVDLDAVVDLGKELYVRKVGAGFLQDQNSWIFMPEWVSFEASVDSVHFKELGTVNNTINAKKDGGITKDFVLRIPKQKIRYLRVIAKNRGVCPAWHTGTGEPAWIFADEIWVE
ncbi:MAG: glycoside hydrolase family 92 protein [Bacteroidetes bacterium]|nr:MAG: glycoside hydrolase family 92 protein [Bacteroidota bacterium]